MKTITIREKLLKKSLKCHFILTVLLHKPRQFSYYLKGIGDNMQGPELARRLTFAATRNVRQFLVRFSLITYLVSSKYGSFIGVGACQATQYAQSN